MELEIRVEALLSRDHLKCGGDESDYKVSEDQDASSGTESHMDSLRLISQPQPFAHWALDLVWLLH